MTAFDKIIKSIRSSSYPQLQVCRTLIEQYRRSRGGANPELNNEVLYMYEELNKRIKELENGK